MDAISSVELAAQRQRSADAAADAARAASAARADVELEAVAAVREGEPVEEVAEAAGIGSTELKQLDKIAGNIPPG